MSQEKRQPTEAPLLEEVEEESDGLPLRERYGFVLALVLVAYVVGGLNESRLALAINSLIWGTVLLLTLWSPGLPKALRRVGLIATVVVFLSGISAALTESTTGDGWRSILLGVAQLAALLAILNRILRHERVAFQTVMGGIAAYAMIAFVMASIYFGLDNLTGTTFLNGVVDNGDYTYFSFVTLTTVGYGDITAATDLAKRLVVVEAFVGQVFIITFVARLVSLWGKPLRSDNG